MSFFNNFTFSDTKTYFGKFKVGTSLNQPTGKYMERFTLDEHGVYNIDHDHATLNNVHKTNGVHVITKGTVLNTFTWDSGDISDSEVTAYKNLINQEHQGGTCSFTSGTNSLTLSYTKNEVITPWKDWQFKYGLKSKGSKMESGSDDFSFFCLTHINDDVEDWTREHGDIAANSSFTVTKPTSSECYVLFSENVSNSNGTLDAYRVYKLTSASTVVTNSTSEVCKMIRLYK